MSFSEKYSQSTIVPTDGTIVVPSGYTGETAIIIPDTQVEYCAREFGLTNKGILGLDPMCGVGTIPRVINKNGGICFGCEIDPERFQAALQANSPDYIFEGDFRNLPFNQVCFDFIFTSIPFAWFKNVKITSTLNPGFARDFQKLLTPGGFLLLDSMPIVEKDGEIWPVSRMQCAYLEQNGFTLERIIAFDNKTHVDISGRSVVMKFTPTSEDRIVEYKSSQ